jgi:hypothetical protein
MQLETPFKVLSLTPSPELMTFDFSSITPEDWDQNQILKLIPIFRELKTFPLRGLPKEFWGDPKNHESITSNASHPVHQLIMNEVHKIEELLNAKAIIAVLDGLAPGTKIYRHYDQSNLYTMCHRVHLPIITHPDVKFFIDDNPYFFKAGEFFEFDNKRFHMVHNDSDIFRIHLVIDLLPNNL